MPLFSLKPPRFRFETVDEAFFETAPNLYSDSFETPRPSSDVWADLVADGALSFCRALHGAKWTSPRPFGIGTTRTMVTAIGLGVQTTFFRWEEGRRYSFSADGADLPLVRRLAEDYMVEETSATTSRFTWTVAIDPYPITRFAEPVTALLVNGLFKDARRHFGTLP